MWCLLRRSCSSLRNAMGNQNDSHGKYTHIFGLLLSNHRTVYNERIWTIIWFQCTNPNPERSFSSDAIGGFLLTTFHVKNWAERNVTHLIPTDGKDAHGKYTHPFWLLCPNHRIVCNFSWIGFQVVRPGIYTNIPSWPRFRIFVPSGSILLNDILFFPWRRRERYESDIQVNHRI